MHVYTLNPPVAVQKLLLLRTSKIHFRRDNPIVPVSRRPAGFDRLAGGRFLEEISRIPSGPNFRCPESTRGFVRCWIEREQQMFVGTRIQFSTAERRKCPGSRRYSSTMGVSTYLRNLCICINVRHFSNKRIHICLKPQGDLGSNFAYPT